MFLNMSNHSNLAIRVAPTRNDAGQELTWGVAPMLQTNATKSVVFGSLSCASGFDCVLWA